MAKKEENAHRDYSPVCDTYKRVVRVDENGTEFVTWEVEDLKKLKDSLGNIFVWNLNAMLAAGINPDFPIHTGFNTRLEGLTTLDDFSQLADRIFAD